MRLSVVLELLLIFILIAFAASRVIDSKDVSEARKMTQVAKKGERQDSVMNKLCNCTDSICNCCREFHVPILNINGPGCARLQYVADDNLSVALSIADRVIATQTLSGRKPRPVCMPLPGGYSKFCGRVYNIARTGEDFKACLGLELQSKSTVEASLRVSCFKFGPRGVIQEAAEPLPLATELEDEEDEDDDEDDFGIGGDDDDDDDDDDEDEDDDDFGIGDDEDDDDEEEEAAGSEADDDSDSTDYTGFSYLEDGLGSLFGSESSGTKKPIKKKTGVAPQVIKPVDATVKPPRKTPTKIKPVRAPVKKQPLSVASNKPVTAAPILSDVTEKTETISPAIPNKDANGLNLLHTSALLQLTNKPDEQNEIGVPSAILIAADSDAGSSGLTAQKITVTNSEKTRPRPNKPEQLNPKPESVAPILYPGIQSSISYITGQLSEAPATTIVSNAKPTADGSDKLEIESSVSTGNVKPTGTLQNKPATTAPVDFENESEEDDDDEGGVVEIVQSFEDDEGKPVSQITVETVPKDDEASKSTEDADESDSDEGEKGTEEKEDDDSDADDDDDEYDDDDDEDDDAGNATDKVETGDADKKKKKKDDDDDDLLGFGAISESLGFNYSKEKKTKVKKGSAATTGLKKKDDDDILSSITDSLGFSRSLNTRNRGRQNKMLKVSTA